MANRKGQIAIFVIVAVVIVASIILFFFLRRAPLGVGEGGFNPEQYIKQCIGPSINEAVDIMLPQGGFLEPKNFKIYNHTNIAYLCKTDKDYSQCINFHPMFINEISGEIKSYLSPIVEGCFANMKTELEKKQAIVEIGDQTSLDISMTTGKVFVDLNKSVKITEKETTRTFDKFKFDVASPIYNLASVAIDIANSERKYCEFDIVGYMFFDRSVSVRKFLMSDSTGIYIIKDKESGKIMNIAIRSCAIPAEF